MHDYYLLGSTPYGHTHTTRPTFSSWYAAACAGGICAPSLISHPGPVLRAQRRCPPADPPARPPEQNPDNKRPGLPCAGPEPQYDERQRAEFGGKGKRGGGGAGGSGSGYSWIGTDDPTLLDVVGTELLLVGARQQAPGKEQEPRAREAQGGGCSAAQGM